jgi:ActR/RegA family two-component response regulator
MRRAWDDLERLTAEWEAKLAADNLAPIETVGRKDIVSLTPAVEARAAGSVWELGATVDALMEALREYRFDVLDAQICEMLSRRVAWHRIARTLHCSKRRVSRVSRTVQVWREQRADRERRVAEVFACARSR